MEQLIKLLKIKGLRLKDALRKILVLIKNLLIFLINTIKQTNINFIHSVLISKESNM